MPRSIFVRTGTSISVFISVLYVLCNALGIYGGSSLFTMLEKPRALSIMKLSRRRQDHAILSSRPSAVLIRGGSLKDNSSFDEEEEEYDNSDAFDLDEADFDMADDEFQEESSLDRALDMWQKTPPLTKSFLAASFATTAYGYFMNKNTFPSFLLLEWKPTLFKFQFWRPFTAFLNFGPFNIGYVLTVHFVWTYMATLERLSHDKPYDFWVMIAFACTSMIMGYSLLGISPRFLGHNVSTFLVYVWARYHEGMEVNLMELFNTRAELLPWFFVAQTALLEGEVPILDLLGILFGHIYYHCKSTNILKTPQILIDWYESDTLYSTMIRNNYRKISSDFEMQ